MRLYLVAADLAGLALALLVTELTLGHAGDWPEVAAFVVTLPAWPIVASLYGLYDHDEQQMDYSTIDELGSIFHLVTVGLWLLYVFGRVTRIFDPSPVKLVMFWILAIIFLMSARGLARTLGRRRSGYLQRALIVGAGDVGQQLASKLSIHREYRVEVVGFVDSEERESPLPEREPWAVLGTPDDLVELVDSLSIDRVIYAFPQTSPEDSLGVLRELRDRNVRIDVLPRFYEVLGSRSAVESVAGIALLGLPPLRLTRPLRVVKRAFDLTLAVLALVVFLPTLCLIALLVKVTSPGPAFFKQIRVGRVGKPFQIYKFRTMVADAEAVKPQFAHLNVHAREGGDARMFKAPSDPRVTTIGKILRAYSLDELPQLINVVRGEMSLVGPRPLILDEDRYVIGWARRRLDLLPGMTGPWQVLGASAIPFGEMVRLDYLYITNWSLFTDVKWIWRTVPTVLRARGA